MLGGKEKPVDWIALPTVQPDTPFLTLPSYQEVAHFLPLANYPVPLPWPTEPPSNLLGSTWEYKPEACIFPGSALCQMAGGTYVI